MFSKKSKEINDTDNKSIIIPESLTLYAGNTIKLTVKSEGEEAIELISMEPVDRGIALVHGGHVIAHGVGETNILTTVSVNGETHTYSTEVIVKPGEVTVTPALSSIQVGETVRLKTMVSNGVYKSIKYQSSNLKAATVRQEGIFGYVTGLSVGTAKIEVTVNIGNEIKTHIILIKVEPAKTQELPISNPVSGEDYTEEDEWKGSRVFFGSYEQDNNPMNGKEPILWRVLEVEKDTVLLMSEYGLMCKFYHDFYENVTWESSSLRSWLNNNFLDTAFTRAEQKAIYDTPIKNSDNKKYGSTGGNKTIDKVFLLSKKEVISTAYGFMSGSKKKSKTRTLRITESALQEGHISKDKESISWWLRSPGITNQFAAYVLASGNVTDTHYVGKHNYAVRPVIRVKRSAILFGNEISDGLYSGPMIIAKEY